MEYHRKYVFRSLGTAVRALKARVRQFFDMSQLVSGACEKRPPLSGNDDSFQLTF